jgi:hypothetical protein
VKLPESTYFQINQVLNVIEVKRYGQDKPQARNGHGEIVKDQE